MNNLKKQNYVKFDLFKRISLKNKIICFLHINYVNAKNLQLFFSHCRENKITMVRFKLNFLKKNLDISSVKVLLVGPSIVLILDKKDVEKISYIEKKFNFVLFLNNVYNGVNFKPTYVKKNLKEISNLSLRLSIPSKILPIFFFKRLTTMLPNLIVRPFLNICFILKYKCLR